MGQRDNNKNRNNNNEKKGTQRLSINIVTSLNVFLDGWCVISLYVFTCLYFDYLYRRIKIQHNSSYIYTKTPNKIYTYRQAMLMTALAVL